MSESCSAESNRSGEGVSTADLRSAVNEAAGVCGGLWISYVLVLFYMLIAVAGVTHTDLFLQNRVKLPFPDVELPLLGFFWLGPVVVLLGHAYVLHNLVMLADKVRELGKAMPQSQRMLLPINLFVQMLAGPCEGEQRQSRWVATLVAWSTLVAGPVCVLAFFELQFLPYHDAGTSWWARLCVLTDLALLWWLWPRVSCRQAPSWRGAEMRASGLWLMATLSAGAVYLVVLVATFPGEWLEAQAIPLHETLLGGKRNGDTFASHTIWTNRLFVTALDLEHEPESGRTGNARAPHVIRGRHLEQAVLTEAHLGRIDLTGAFMEGASLERIHAQGAYFDYADLRGAQFDDARLAGASFYKARLAGSTWADAHLQGAQLAGADLRGAWMAKARLDGASVAGADLRRATLDDAVLAGASMNEAQLQVASLAGARLDGASLDRAHLWKADFQRAEGKTAVRRSAVDQDAEKECDATDEACVTGKPIRDLVERDVPDGASRTGMLGRLGKPTKLHDEKDDWEAASDEAFKNLANMPDENDAPTDLKLAALWKQIACIGDGAPYVISTMVETFDDQQGWTRPTTAEGAEALVDGLLGETCTAKPALVPELTRSLKDLQLQRKPAPIPRVAALRMRFQTGL